MTAFFRSGSTCEGVRIITKLLPEFCHGTCTFTILQYWYCSSMYYYSKPAASECSQNNMQRRLTPQLQFTKPELVQRIGGLTLADPIYVLMIVLQRASDTMMVAMTIN
jgi:hypothetical protein